MHFTCEAYKHLINTLKSCGYEFCFYSNANDYKKSVIIRHDVDFQLDKALEIAEIEHELGIASTYFILLASDFYNIFSKRSYSIIGNILSLGHKIGLHFDEQRYCVESIDDLKSNIEFEAEIMGKLLGQKIEVVSMHRPSKLILDSNIQFNNLINSYSYKYFKEMKYLSDSRMNWREDVIKIVESRIYDKLHILTHAFWYSHGLESIEHKLRKFIVNAKSDRYSQLRENLRNIDEFLFGEDFAAREYSLSHTLKENKKR